MKEFLLHITITNMNLDSLIPEEKARLNVYSKLHTLLLSHAKDLSPMDVQKMALNIERGILNYVLKQVAGSNTKVIWNDNFKRRYNARAITIFTNLNPDSYLENTNLIQRLLNKDFNEFELCTYGPDQLFPERWNERMKEYNEEFNKEYKKEEVPDGILRCGKCRSYKTDYHQLQTSSGDESFTTYVLCKNCGNRWKFR